MLIDRRSRLPVRWAFWLLLWGALQPVAAQDVERVRLTQVHVRLPQVIAYLDAMDGAGMRAAGLDQVTATLGEKPLRLEELEPFDASGEGIAYIFLVDVSRSLAAEQFEQMRAALGRWISDLSANDRAAILAFGDGCRTAADFTGDRQALNAALAALGPTDQTTNLHLALERALELGHRQDPGLPSRRVAVVLTDGRDEGSGLADDDVARRIGEQPLPIYAIGYSRLRPPNRQTYLDVLHRFATLSGGLFVAGDQGSLDAHYAGLRQAIERVWVARFTCTDCRADGQSYRFQASVEVSGRVFPAGMDVRLIPRSLPEPPPETLPGTGPPQELPAAEDSLRWWLAGAGVAILLLALILWWRSRRRQTAGEPLEAESLPELDRPAPAPEPAGLAGAPAAATEPRPPRNLGMPIQLVVVRGRKPGRVYSARVADRCSVGTAGSNDLVLRQEDGVEPSHFELSRETDKLWIRPLTRRRSTSVNGVPTDNRHQLENDDLVLAGNTELRIVFEET